MEVGLSFWICFVSSLLCRNMAIDAEYNISRKYSGFFRSSVKRRAPTFSLSMSPSEIIEKLLINYIRTEPPILDAPTEVKLGIYVISFYSINEQTMDYSVSMYLRQAWRDPRLAYEKYGKQFPVIRLGDNSWNKIWIPDTFLRNEKAASFHGVTVENRMLKLKPNGDIWYVTKISATLSCPMTLEKFPMDTQVCPMAFESFGYTMDTMYFSQLPAPVDVSADLQLPQFTLINQKVIDCSQNYTTGAYPCLQIEFVLARDIGYFLIQVYVPSVLIVILSWVSFWINVDASPARVSIGLLTVLTTTTMSSGARSSLPRVSYIKAIDVWMIVCLVFVFTSLIEYAVVNVLARKQPRPASKPAPQARAAGPPGSTPVGGGPPVNSRQRGNDGVPLQQMDKKKPILSCFKTNVYDNATGHPAPHPPAAPLVEVDGKRRARAVDKLSRKLFPISFIFFNIVYWIVFTEPFSSKKPYEE